MMCLRSGKLLNKISYVLPNTIVHVSPTPSMDGPLDSVLRNSGLRRGVSSPEAFPALRTTYQ